MPGMNLENKSAFEPRAEKEVSVLRTHVSGSSESLQSKLRTERPLYLPMWYQAISPMTAGARALRTERKNE